MASTSHDQSSGTNASSSRSSSDDDNPRYEHDVFLSFRGTDTRKGFTSHLHDALTRFGIKTFMDDQELPTGGNINPRLIKAIQKSKASIIVFSEDYASSTWCLRELVEILECKKMKGQLVFPIYYDVEPTVLRNITGKYAEAFQTKHTEGPEVQKWRAALQEVANLKGHVLANEDDGNESKFIQKIVRKVISEVIEGSSNVTEPLIEAGADSNRNCINTFLSIESNDARIIGISGMGGIGKSFISKAIYHEHKNKFDCSAVVENIKDVSKQANGLLELQERLLRQLVKDKDVKLNTTDEGTERIRRICESKKVLILLDDFDNFYQINKLVGQKSWLSAGSRVITVTRDMRLLKEVQVQHTHEMKLLNEEESLKLFTKNAIKEEETPSEDRISLSKDIARYCGGLPLALEVIGRCLLEHDLEYWKNALKDFQTKPNETVYGRLKISYDALSKENKTVFLDAACFFIGWNVEYLKMFWVGCRLSANCIRDLTDKCLFKIDESNCLWMHDQLRDMGRAVVLDASDSSLVKQSRLWIQNEDVQDLLRNEIKEKTEIEGIRVDVSALESLDAEAFKTMPRLRLLVIEVDVHDTSGRFENVFRELRWFTWKLCRLDHLPSDFLPKKLVGLDMKSSKIKKLWEGVKHLLHLSIVDLSYCGLLEETPDFSGTPSLERLILNSCTSLSRIHPSIWRLTSLVDLQMGSCISITEVPEQVGHMESLQTLNLRGTSITELPDSIGQLSRLVSLRLDYCPKLKTLPDSICNLRSLEEINVKGLANVRQVHTNVGAMKPLLHQNPGVDNFINLTESAYNLTALETLNPRLLELDKEWCTKVSRPPPASTSNLQKQLYDVKRFITPRTLGNLTKVKRMDEGRRKPQLSWLMNKPSL